MFPVSTDVLAPGGIFVECIGTNSVTLVWSPPDSISSFEFTYSSATTTKTSAISNVKTIEVEGLCPETEYMFSLVSISENGGRSVGVTTTACTSNSLSFIYIKNQIKHCDIKKYFFIAEPVPPENFKVENVSSTSVTLIWDAAGSTKKKFHLLCSQNREIIQATTTEKGTVIFSDLNPGKKYSFHIATVLTNGDRSKEAVTYAQTS